MLAVTVNELARSAEDKDLRDASRPHNTPIYHNDSQSYLLVH